MTNGVAKSYYSFGGQTILRTFNVERQTWELSYFLTDHLGSVVAVTSDRINSDTPGTLITQQRYLPFGGARTNIGVITQTDYGYTGQREMGMGLMDYKFRFYSPLLGRFISPDTITPDMTQGLNRYSYVANRPVNFNDPTGHVYCGQGLQCGEGTPNGGSPTTPIPNSGRNGGDDDTDTDGDGIPNIPDPDYPLITPRDHVQADCIPGNLVECFYGTGILPDGDYEITLLEFLQLMKAISYDVSRRNATENYDFRGWYDTPFYDAGRLKSNLCVQTLGCFARNELNYIAQGAASAAAMEGKGLMILSIAAWKRREYGEWPSAGTLGAAAIGHDYYSMTHAQNYLLLITPLRNPVPFIDAVQTHCQPITVCLPTP